MYNLSIKQSLDKKFKKLARKDKELLKIIERKVNDILIDPHRFKTLRKPLQNKHRVHIAGSFVLIYSVDEKEKIVTLLDFDHHDNIYES